MNHFQQIFIIFLLAYLIILFFILTLNFKQNHHQCITYYDPIEPQVIGFILEFENFQNNLFDTVKNVCQSIPHVVVYSETFIYPQINFSKINCQITLIELKKSIHNSFLQKDINNLLNADYLLIFSDSTRLNFKSQISLANELIFQIKLSNADALLIPIYSTFNQTFQLKCNYFYFDVKKWTLEYLNKSNRNCLYDNENEFVVFLKKKSLFKLSFPLLRPFLQSFLIQSQVSKLRIELFNKSLFSSETKLFSDGYSKEKHDLLVKQRLGWMRSELGIKKITYPNNSIEWYGCDRKQYRCFGSIIDNVPDYLIKGRWLPPCCRRNLETTGLYVFRLLEKFQIRYWLEGGSLLGAARNGQIIDWDYDIDIGIYQEDMDKLPILKNLFSKSPGYRIEDGQGFVWERALEGKFIKVHFSLMNRIHVDIFPFISINGTMTKETWFDDHPQDMPFPESFLKPLEKISFIGFNASSPNNIRDFLEIKFGKNVIEQPKYPIDKIEL